jgi:hypothetical protein
VVRSRLDTAVHTPEDVELAWDGEPVEVVSSAAGRARHSRLAGRPAAVLARRLETAAELRPLRVVLVCPAPTEGTVARRLAADVAADLVDRGVDAAVGRAAQVRLEVGDPLAPARVWREAAGRRDDVVLVMPSGRVASVELREVRRTLRDAGLRPLALVLVGRATRPAATGGTASNAEAREVPVARGARPDGVVAGSSPGGAPTAFPAQR